MARKSIADVAARADVSIKTVSRVLNDEPGVRPETRQRIREAMAALNYQPSLAARSLAGKRSNLLGLLYANPSPNYLFDVQNGAMIRCREEGRHLFLQSCEGEGDALIPDVLAVIEQIKIDGLVLTPPLSGNRGLIAALDDKGIAFVRMAPDDLDHPSPSVEMDDRAAAQDMTDLLLGLGHRNIGFVAGHPAHHSSRLRFKGYRDAIEAGGLALADQAIEQGYNDVQSGLDAGRRLLGRGNPPTAIFASNDDMAAGIVLAAHRLGIAVPGELSVAGYDDSQLAAMSWPALTTIHQPSYDMCYAATGLLIDTIKGNTVPAVTRCEYRMVVRDSTGPAR